MILIVGCGFLGSYLLKYVSEKTDEKIVATVRNSNSVVPLDGVEYVKCDVGDKNDLISLVEKCKGESLTVFYFAACHNIDYVYENPEAARKINIDALQSFLNNVPFIKKFFFASTDCVYGEGKYSAEKFSETSPTAPVNEYGRQKLEAEKIVLSHGFTVLRLPFMLGPSLISKPHFYDNIHKKLASGEPIEMIDGMKRSVLSYQQAAKIVYSLSGLTHIPQIVNVCADEELSKYEMGCTIAHNLAVSQSLVKSISQEKGAKFFKDDRAFLTAMDNTLLKSLLGIDSIVWDEKSRYLTKTNNP